MNLADLQRKLLAAARAQAPADRVPYAFEKRITARLQSLKADAWALWGRGLWRAAVPCIAVSLLLGAWAWLAPSPPPNPDLSQDFENTVLAAAAQDSTVETIW